MKLSARSLFVAIGAMCAITFAASPLNADSFTQTGTFTADNSVFTYNFNIAAATAVNIYTTSYGGGVNADGSTTAAGGFVPNLTLFSGSGQVLANNGAGATPSPFAGRDSATGRYDDAYLSLSLAAGAYTLTLSEFPNVAIGNLADGFLFSSDPHATGNACGSPTGSFLEADQSPCVQRTSAYTVNVASTPEPATALLLLPAIGCILAFRKRFASGLRS